MMRVCCVYAVHAYCIVRIHSSLATSLPSSSSSSSSSHCCHHHHPHHNFIITILITNKQKRKTFPSINKDKNHSHTHTKKIIPMYTHSWKGQTVEHLLYLVAQAPVWVYTQQQQHPLHGHCHLMLRLHYKHSVHNCGMLRCQDVVLLAIHVCETFLFPYAHIFCNTYTPFAICLHLSLYLYTFCNTYTPFAIHIHIQPVQHTHTHNTHTHTHITHTIHVHNRPTKPVEDAATLASAASASKEVFEQKVHTYCQSCIHTYCQQVLSGNINHSKI